MVIRAVYLIIQFFIKVNKIYTYCYKEDKGRCLWFLKYEASEK